MSTLRRNILYNVAGQGLLLLLGLGAVRLVFHRLGADAFGIILFAQSSGLVLASMLELGISATTVREVASHLKDDRPYVLDLLRTAALLYWAAYLALVVALMMGAAWIATRWLTVKAIDPASASQLLQVLGTGALLVLPRSLYASLFRGLQRMGVTNAIEVGAMALQLLGTIAILILHGGVFGVAWWLTATYALSVVAYLGFALRAGVPWRALLPGFSMPVLRRNARFATHMMSISALGAVYGQQDKLLVSKLMPVRLLGTFGFASTMVASVLRLLSAIVQAAFPAFAEMVRRQDRSEMMRRYHRVHALITFGAVPCFTGLVFAAKPLFGYVFDDAIARELMLPTALLCLGSYMNATLQAPYMVSLAVGKPEIAVRQNLIALVTVLPLSVVSVWRFGLAGAGLAWVLHHVLAYGYGVPRMCRECLELPTSQWFAGVLRIMALALVTYGPAFVIAAALGSGIVVLSVSFALATAAYAALGFLTMGRELRPAVRQINVADAA